MKPISPEKIKTAYEEGKMAAAIEIRPSMAASSPCDILGHAFHRLVISPDCKGFGVIDLDYCDRCGCVKDQA